MLSGSSTYFEPEYIQPLPPSLNSKHNPLALLMQTCNNIGKDEDAATSSPVKETAPRSSSTCSGRLSSLSPSAADSKRTPNSSDKNRNKTESVSSRTQASSREATDSTAKDTSREKPSDTVDNQDDKPESQTMDSKSADKSAQLQGSSRISLTCGSVSLEVSHKESSTVSGYSAAKRHSTEASDKPEPKSHESSRFSPTVPKLNNHDILFPPPGSAFPYANSHLLHPSLSVLGHGMPLDLAPQASLAAAHLGLRGMGYPLEASRSGSPSRSGLSPYPGYTYMRTASGATTLVPACRDPYCVGCQHSSRNPGHAAICQSGCTQCQHESALPTAHQPGHSHLPTASVPASAHLLKPEVPSLPSWHPYNVHAYGAQLQGQPHVCNWFSGTEYCGKRFTSSEELIQHMRSHTTGLDSATLPPGLSHYGSSFLQSGYNPHVSLSNSVRYSYPSSLTSSPSHLLASSRYNPYKSPLTTSLAHPTSHAYLGTAAPSLEEYYATLALYGQKLGAVP